MTADLIGVALGIWAVSLRLLVAVLVGVMAYAVRRRWIEPGALLIGGVLSVVGLDVVSRSGPALYGHASVVLGVAAAVGAVWAVVRTSVSVWSLLAYNAAVFSVEPLSFGLVMERLLFGVPAQAIPMVVAYIAVSAARSAQSAADDAMRLEAAMATCSAALLTGGEGDDALKTAVTALLDATSAGYVYVDVNWIEDGVRHWRIVAEAEVPGRFDGPGMFDGGTYDDMEWVAADLAAGRPVIIGVEALKSGSMTAAAYAPGGGGVRPRRPDLRRGPLGGGHRLRQPRATRVDTAGDRHGLPCRRDDRRPLGTPVREGRSVGPQRRQESLRGVGQSRVANPAHGGAGLRL